MRSVPVVAAFALRVALSVSFVACGDDGPTRPTPPPSTPPPTTPPVVTVTRLEVSGPGSVPPGGTAQFTATAHMSDGSTQDVTTQASWRTGHSGILTVSSSGLVSGRQRGETSLTASISGRPATQSEVLVLPPGTYRVVGTVRDAGFPVTGAQVAVTSGTATGLSAGASPEYRLYGVAGPTELRVTRDGYHEQKTRLDVARHERVDFDLTLSGPRTEAAGTYTLEVSANPACRGRLPEAAQTRRYAATIVQDGPRVSVTLSGAFRTHDGRQRNSFSGMVEPGGIATFRLDAPYCGFYYYYYDCSPMDAEVVEEIAPETTLVIAGSAFVRDSGSMMSGALSGSITTYDAALKPAATCSAGRHSFVLSR